MDRQQLQSQKMEAIGHLTSGIIHDFNNLIMVINGYSELILTRLAENDPNREDIIGIHMAGKRAAKLTQQLLSFSKNRGIKIQTLNLNLILETLIKMLRRIIGENIQLNVIRGKNLGNIKADLGHIEQIIINLAINSRDAMPDGGEITIETANIEIDESFVKNTSNVKPGKYIKLSFHDSGIGIPKKIQDNIFNPFFTTKEIGNNSGLGLSVVAGIVGENKGFIRVSSKPNNGTRFDIYFPQVNTKLTEQSSGHKEKSSSTGNETILIVEDEDILCNMLYKIFLMNGYTVLTAANLKESLKVFKTHDSPIRLLITDIVLPEIKECDLKKRISSLFPEVKVICMSGYPEDEIAPYISVDENNDYLQKPFTISELLFKVRRLLDNNEKKY